MLEQCGGNSSWRQNTWQPTAQQTRNRDDRKWHQDVNRKTHPINPLPPAGPHQSPHSSQTQRHWLRTKLKPMSLWAMPYNHMLMLLVTLMVLFVQPLSSRPGFPLKDRFRQLLQVLFPCPDHWRHFCGFCLLCLVTGCPSVCLARLEPLYHCLLSSVISDEPLPSFL